MITLCVNCHHCLSHRMGICLLSEGEKGEGRNRTDASSGDRFDRVKYCKSCCIFHSLMYNLLCQLWPPSPPCRTPPSGWPGCVSGSSPQSTRSADTGARPAGPPSCPRPAPGEQPNVWPTRWSRRQGNCSLPPRMRHGLPPGWSRSCGRPGLEIRGRRRPGTRRPRAGWPQRMPPRGRSNATRTTSPTSPGSSVPGGGTICGQSPRTMCPTSTTVCSRPASRPPRPSTSPRRSGRSSAARSCCGTSRPTRPSCSGCAGAWNSPAGSRSPRPM